MTSSIFIAKRKNERTHVFLRAYRRKALTEVDYGFPSDSIDKLLLAQDPESFTYAVSDFYPLSIEPLCKREAKSQPRKQTVKEFRANCESLYEFVDDAALLEEYTGVKDDGTELNKSSLKRAVKKFDAMRGGSFMRHLSDNAFADDDYVVAEPVQDWTAAKAFMSNVVLFQAYSNREIKGLDFEETATHNGYWVYGRAFDKRIKERVKQFTYNSEWRNETVGEILADSLKSDNAYSSDPLLSKYFQWETHAINSGKDVNHLRNSQHIRFKTANSISGEPLSLFARGRKAVTDRSLYLAADLDCSEEEIAHDFIEAVLSTTQELESNDGLPLGWEYDLSTAAEQADMPGVVFHSQWAQLIYKVAFHPHDVKAAICKNCGRPMLNKSGSKPRQFCRPSCKTAYSIARKADSDD